MVKEFLATPEAYSSIRQIYSLQLTSGGQDRLADIRSVFGQSLALFLGKKPEDIRTMSENLLEGIISACNNALEAASEQGILTAQSAATAYHTRVLRDELANVSHALAFLGRGSGISLEEFLDFEKKYRKQVGSANKDITPPNIEGLKKVPIEKLFVPSNFHRASKQKRNHIEDLGISEFLSLAYRAVILGNPGGGKSTFVRKLCHDLAAHYSDRRFAGRELTPILVILRDYGSEKKSRGISVLQFMELNSNSDYQIPAPAGALEYLLFSGRALVVFDGLDELLETSDRQKITRDVELFADLYPSVPIIVTSREVGYEQAPLDEERFETFRLAPFSSDQTESYVHKWFATSTELTPTEQKKKASSFLAESQIVPDLISNPLMLALMCTIYRGEGTIPRNRPDVYAKCAEMLFEKWDKRRGIHVTLPFEAHVRPAMNHLASWIYSDETLQRGVSENSLVQETTRYLLAWCFDDTRQAEAAAIQFIEFCSGRAWVFTDTGTKSGGERLYQFTHRTFLEYFTAVHLVQTHRTPTELAGLLHPHIAKREWDTVAQLAFQLKGKGFQGDTDLLIEGLLSAARTAEGSAAWNLIDFAARCLGFMVPTPPVRRRVTEACLNLCMAWRRQGTLPLRDQHEPGSGPDQVIGSLLCAASENRVAVADSLKRHLGQVISEGGDEEAGLAAELARDLAFPIQVMEIRARPDDTVSFWESVSRELIRDNAIRIQQIAKTDASVAVECVWEHLSTVEEVVSWHGIETLFRETPLRMFQGIRISVATSVVHSVTTWPQSAQSIQHTRNNLAIAEGIGRVLLHASPPWLRFQFPRESEIEWTFGGRPDSRALATRVDDSLIPSSDALFGVFILLAMMVNTEKGKRIFLSLGSTLRNPVFVKLVPLLSKGFAADKTDSAKKEMAGLAFNEQQQELVEKILTNRIQMFEPAEETQ